MNNKVKHKLSQLEGSREKLLSRVRDISDETLNEKPFENEWSLAQVLYHLYLVDKMTLEYMKERIKEGKVTSKVGLKEKWRNQLLKLALFLPLKFKAPSSVKNSIPEQVNMPELLDKWQETRNDLEQFVQELPPKTYKLKIFRHPRIGMINLYQTLGFIQDHFDHHRPQVKRLLSKFNTA